MRSSFVVGGLVVGLSCVVQACAAKDPSLRRTDVVDNVPIPKTDGTTEGTCTPEDGDPTPSSEPTTPAKTGAEVSTESLVISANTREYVLSVPKSYVAGRAYPLVLFFHGDGGDGPQARAMEAINPWTDDVAIVAYPTGRSAAWDLYTPTHANEDLAFIEALIATLKDRFTIAPGRVFGAGYSSGAFLVNQIACRRPGLLNAIAVHAGGAPAEPMVSNTEQWPNGWLKCPGQSGVPALVIHGDADGVVSPDSGDYDAEYWAYVNGCSSERQPASPAPCAEHVACPADRRVLYCLIPGLGHTVWQQGGREAWAFFSSQ